MDYPDSKKDYAEILDFPKNLLIFYLTDKGVFPIRKLKYERSDIHARI